MSIMAADAFNSREQVVQELKMEWKGCAEFTALQFDAIIGQVWKQMNGWPHLCVDLLIYRPLVLLFLLDCQKLRQGPNCHSLKTSERVWEYVFSLLKFVFLSLYKLRKNYFLNFNNNP